MPSEIKRCETESPTDLLFSLFLIFSLPLFLSFFLSFPFSLSHISLSFSFTHILFSSLFLSPSVALSHALSPPSHIFSLPFSFFLSLSPLSPLSLSPLSLSLSLPLSPLSLPTSLSPSLSLIPSSAHTFSFHLSFSPNLFQRLSNPGRAVGRGDDVAVHEEGDEHDVVGPVVEDREKPVLGPRHHLEVSRNVEKCREMSSIEKYWEASRSVKKHLDSCDCWKLFEKNILRKSRMLRMCRETSRVSRMSRNVKKCRDQKKFEKCREMLRMARQLFEIVMGVGDIDCARNVKNVKS